MRRTVLLIASTALAVLLTCGVAYAITKNCTAGADYCVGTNAPDTLNGSDERDKIYGKDANDELLGNSGNDSLIGGNGGDVMRGGADNDRFGSNSSPGTDRLYGDGGNDTLYDSSSTCASDCLEDRNILSGGPGDDDLYGQNRLYGGPGDDDIDVGSPIFDGSYAKSKTVVSGGSGIDEITSRGEKVQDTIFVRDGEHDTVSCGPGDDTVYFDEGIDSVNPVNCEHRIGD